MVVRIFICILISTFFIACGSPEHQATFKENNIVANPMISDSRTPINENIVASTVSSDGHIPINENNLSKCREKLVPIPSSFNGYFNSHHQNSSYLSGQINHYVEENSFNQALKDLVFTKDEPCKQIQIAFSGDFVNNTALRLKISKPDANRELISFKPLKIKDFAPSYFAVINDFLPDNMSRLPNHYFEVNVSCPTGMTVFCPREGENCDVSKQLKAKFPDEPCTIKGSDQVFALYPSGQVRINFEGTVTKIGTSENNMDAVEIKFTNIEWR